MKPCLLERRREAGSLDRIERATLLAQIAAVEEFRLGSLVVPGDGEKDDLDRRIQVLAIDSRILNFRKLF